MTDLEVEFENIDKGDHIFSDDLKECYFDDEETEEIMDNSIQIVKLTIGDFKQYFVREEVAGKVITNIYIPHITSEGGGLLRTVLQVLYPVYKQQVKANKIYLWAGELIGKKPSGKTLWARLGFMARKRENVETVLNYGLGNGLIQKKTYEKFCDEKTRLLKTNTPFPFPMSYIYVLKNGKQMLEEAPYLKENRFDGWAGELNLKPRKKIEQKMLRRFIIFIDKLYKRKDKRM
ncbi:MAG: hypothetical protein H7A23_09990 [Leptospiraceae bacterium]|nr:hypothetical protein [Leptospiraceae bacterium]